MGTNADSRLYENDNIKIYRYVTIDDDNVIIVDQLGRTIEIPYHNWRHIVNTFASRGSDMRG